MRIAKLYIKGVKEPIELTKEQGLEAQKIKAGEGKYANMKDSKVLSIDDVWTGEKGDIRYVVFSKYETSIQADENKYSARELMDFEIELAPYLTREGDVDFNVWVDKILEHTLNLDSKLRFGDDIKKRIISIRNKNGKTIENLKKNKVKVKKNIIKLGNEYIVGYLTHKKELEYLIKEKAIKMNKDGHSYAVLVYKDGSMPFQELHKKLGEYRDWKFRKEYASRMELLQYDEMAGEVAEGMSMNKDVGVGIHEEF